MGKETLYNKKRLKTIVCNLCGEILQEEGKRTAEKDWLVVQKSWGYFSGKDREKHSFCICESCYDHWTAGFSVPVEVREETELLFP